MGSIESTFPESDVDPSIPSSDEAVYTEPNSRHVREAINYIIDNPPFKQRGFRCIKPDRSCALRIDGLEGKTENTVIENPTLMRDWVGAGEIHSFILQIGERQVSFVARHREERDAPPIVFEEHGEEVKDSKDKAVFGTAIVFLSDALLEHLTPKAD